MTANVRVATIGFTRKSARRFFQLLRESGVKRVVDVRLNNVSQLAGFAKRDDLEWFLDSICRIDYVHLPCLAPTKELLRDYRQGGIDWGTYARRFVDLIHERRIEDEIEKDLLEESCLLCSEDKPHHCHRRLVAEYLNDQWGGVDIQHLG